jgi:hypothetical protein
MTTAPSGTGISAFRGIENASADEALEALLAS